MKAICRTSDGKSFAVTILSRADFSAYDYNNPSKMTGVSWELIQFEDGLRAWAPVTMLEVVR